MSLDVCDKRGYSKREAETARNSRLRGRKGRRNTRPGYLRIYECPRCGRWHLTSAPYQPCPGCLPWPWLAKKARAGLDGGLMRF